MNFIRINGLPQCCTVFVTFMSLETLGVFWFRSLGTLRVLVFRNSKI